MTLRRMETDHARAPSQKDVEALETGATALTIVIRRSDGIDVEDPSYVKEPLQERFDNSALGKRMFRL